MEENTGYDPFEKMFAVQATEVANPEPAAQTEPPQQAAQPEAATPSEPIVNTPSVTPEVPVFDWTTHLVEATKGQIKNADELGAVLTEKQALAQAKADLEAKFENMHPMLKKEYELRSKGATDTEINNWRNLQSVNVDAMSTLDAIKEYYKLNEPLSFMKDGKFDNDLLNEYVSEKYDKDPSDLTPTERIELNRTVTQAKDYLRNQIVNSENVESIKQQQVREQQHQTYLTQLHSNFNNLVQSGLSEKFETVVEGLENVEGGKLDISYSFDPQTRNEILELTKQQASVLGINPNDSTSIKQLAQRFAFAMKGEEMIAQAVRTATAKAKQATVKELSGDAAKTDNIEIPQQTKTWYDDYREGRPQ